MDFNKQTDPKVIPNLSSDHASSLPKKEKNSMPNYGANTFTKHDSSSFKNNDINYNSPVIPDFTKYRNEEVKMPKEDYTLEEILKRPIADSSKPVKLDSTGKENLSFSKSMLDPNNKSNPVDEVFQNASISKEEIKNDDLMDIKKVSPKKNNNYMKWIIIGIIIEVIILLVIFLVKNNGSKETLECNSSNYNEYYGATIIDTKRYYFKNGKITKLVNTTKYKFDDKEKYNNYKDTYANPEYKVIDGRIVVTNINDNDLSYEEKSTYDYQKLRKLNTSNDPHTIFVNTDNAFDSINLIDYNITDVKIIYQDDYTCR